MQLPFWRQAARSRPQLGGRPRQALRRASRPGRPAWLPRRAADLCQCRPIAPGRGVPPTGRRRRARFGGLWKSPTVLKNAFILRGRGRDAKLRRKRSPRLRHRALSHQFLSDVFLLRAIFATSEQAHANHVSWVGGRCPVSLYESTPDAPSSRMTRRVMPVWLVAKRNQRVTGMPSARHTK